MPARNINFLLRYAEKIIESYETERMKKIRN